MQNRYVLILVSLNPDRSDLSGNLFPESGFIQAKNFKPDDNIQTGLYGTLWGKTESKKWLNVAPDAVWTVVRVEFNDDVIPLDKDNNFYKFKSGIIVFSGPYEDCSKYVRNNCPDTVRNDIAGIKIQSLAAEDHAFTKGYETEASTHNAGTHALNLGEKGKAISEGYGSHAISLGDMGYAESSGEEGYAIAVASRSKAVATGPEARAVATGIHSEARSGLKGISVALDVGGQCKAGEDGMIALAYYDDDLRIRLKVGYVGENIEVDTLYELNDSHEFIPVSNS